MSNNHKNILVCVSGLTPQIVSETFYCLAVQKKIVIDEIYVLTTKRGRDVILGIDDAHYTPKSVLKKELINLCAKYKIKMPLFENNDSHIITAKEESLELSDIRTDKHNILFPNKTCEFINKLSSDPNSTLYCSISGGRKTMGVHLAFALSLFGRENDKLLHVLTSEENEFKGFYPVNKKEDKALELAEIPFVRLRSVTLLKDEKKSKSKLKYAEIVKLTQNELHKVSDVNKLIIKINEKEITYGDNTVKFEPQEFAIYFKFAEQKVEGVNKISIHHIISTEFAYSLVDFIKENYEYYYFSEEIKNPWWKSGFTAENFRSKRAKINKKLSELFDDEIIKEDFLISSIKNYRETAYHIKAAANKLKIMY